MNDDGHRRCQYVLRWDKDSFSCFTAINFFTLRAYCNWIVHDRNTIFLYLLHYLDMHIRIFTIVINVHDVHDEPLKNLRINFNQNQLSAFECRKGKYLPKNNSRKIFVRFFDCIWLETNSKREKKLQTICWRCIICPAFLWNKPTWKINGKR